MQASNRESRRRWFFLFIVVVVVVLETKEMVFVVLCCSISIFGVTIGGFFSPLHLIKAALQVVNC